MYRGVDNSILFGEAIIVAMHKILTTEKLRYRMIAIILIGVFAGFFIGVPTYLAFYKMFMIGIFTALIIWLVLENKKNIKFEKKDLKYIITAICIAIILFGAIIAICIEMQMKLATPIMDIIKEEATEEPSDNSLTYLLSYGYSIFLPFKDTGNNVKYSSFLSLFPLSLIMGMIYVTKREKHTEFLYPMTLVTAFEAVLCMLNKVFVVSYIDMCAMAVGLACVYIYIYMIANIDENIFPIKVAIRLTLIFLIIYFIAPRPEIFAGRGYMYILSIVITLLYFFLVNFAVPKYKRVLVVLFASITIISSFAIITEFVNYKENRAIQGPGSILFSENVN